MLIFRNKPNFGKKIEVEFNEPTTYQDLCKKYPKLRELDIFIKNENQLHNIARDLNDYRIIVDYDGFSIHFDKKNDKFPHFEEWTRKCRAKLGSNSWIPCIGDLFYNKDDKSFYRVSLDEGLWQPQKTKLPKGAKDYAACIVGRFQNMVIIDEALELGLSNKAVEHLNKDIIPRVKKIFRV